MSTEDLIEQSNRQEVSRFKESFSKFLKKWPWLLLSLIFAVAIAYVYLGFKSNVYKVESVVQIKKSNRMEDPGDLLFSGRSITRFAGITDESVIFKSYPLVKSVIEELNLEVMYYVYHGFKTEEIYKNTPFLFKYDREQNQQVPEGVQFEVKILDENRFEIKSTAPFQGKLLQNIEEFGSIINLGSFSFILVKNESYSAKSEIESSYIVRLTSVQQTTYSYRAQLKFAEGEMMSNLLTMSMQTAVPEKSIAFINGLVDKYIEQSLQDKNEVAKNTVEFIDQQLAVISDSLNRKEQNLADFKSSESIGSLSSEGSVLVQKYNEIETEKAKYEVMQKYYNYLQEKLVDKDGQNLENLIAPSAFGIEDLIVNELVKSLIELNLTRNKLMKDGNTKSPLLSQVEDRRIEVIGALEESIENLAKANKILLNDLNNRSNELSSTAQKLPATQLKLVNLNRLLKLNENIYLFLMEKRSSAAITMSSNTPDCKVIEPAMLNPLNPIAPNRKMHYLIAILLGLAIPTIIFVSIDFLNDTIRDKDDITSTSDIPVMGIIPNSKNIENNRIVFDQPKSALAEAFRTIRTNLTFYQQKKSSFVIMVTSTVAREGKSFCSINLAASLAASGKRTVLLGFDLRKPQIHNYLDLENNAGISSYLSGNAKVDDIVLKTAQPNLFVISSGPVPPNPAELISTPKTNELIADMKRQFDYVIIDTPPIGLVADALLLQQESDLNLYIVRQNYSKREFLNQINEFYKTSKLTNLSIVLNDVDKSSNNNYGYYEEESKRTKRSLFKTNKA
jgi:capsular exopolysaccharide synthesis family protein